MFEEEVAVKFKPDAFESWLIVQSELEVLEIPFGIKLMRNDDGEIIGFRGTREACDLFKQDVERMAVF
jgi:hypothetical protein